MTDRARLMAVILLFLVTRLVILGFYQHAGTDVVIYHEYAKRAASGETPYRELAIEYPPVSWWTMALPGVSNPAEAGSSRHTEWPTYLQRFRRLMFVCDAAAFALLLSVAKRRRPADAALMAATYVIATAALAPVLYDRLDAGLLLLLMLWAYAWIRSLDGGPVAEVWLGLAYFTLGVGIAYKLVPVFVVPVVLASELKRGLGTMAMRLAAVALGAVPPFLVHYPSAGWGTLALFPHHAGRGIEIGSIFSNVLWILSAAGLPVRVEYRYTSFELVSAISSAMATLSTVVTAGIIAMIGWLGLGKGDERDHVRGFALASLTLPATLVVSKILSPQYFVWGIPLMILGGAELIDSRQKFMVFCAALVVLAALTTVVYPIGFGGLRALRPDVWVILSVRNVVLIALVGWLTVLAVGRQTRLA